MSERRVSLAPEAIDALELLARDMWRIGYKVAPADLASAVICGTTPAQAVGMCQQFFMDQAAQEAAR